MASSGKKQKKNKWKQIDPSLIIDTSSLPIKPTSWADSVELDEREQLYSSKPMQKIVLPSAPRAAIDAEVYERTIPHDGPFLADLSNLSFDIVDEDIYEFFGDLRVARIDLPRDDRGGGGRTKGYATIEFENRESLITALGYIDASIKGRRVRIDLHNADNDRNNRGGNERRQYRDRNDTRDRTNDDPDRTSSDWRSAPRAEVEERRRPYGGRDSSDRYANRDDRRQFTRNTDDESRVMTREDFGTAKPSQIERGGDRSRGGGGGFTDRGGSGGGFDRTFDRSEMKDPTKDPSPNRFSRSTDQGRERSFDRSQMRDAREARTERTFDRTELRDATRDVSPPPSEPKTRPKLNLQPRTKPIEIPPPLPQPPLDEEPIPITETIKPTPAPKPSAASIFGAAKPVDTAARERELEEKLRALDVLPRPKGSERSSNYDNAQTSRSRGPSPNPIDVDSSRRGDESAEVPSPPENVWAKRSQMLNSNLTNGADEDDVTSPANSEFKDNNDVRDSPRDRDNISSANENDENRQPNEIVDTPRVGGGGRGASPPLSSKQATAEDDDADFELAKDRSTRRRENFNRDGPPKDNRDHRGPPPRRNLDDRGPPPRDRDYRSFRNNDDRSKRPPTFNRDRDNNRDRPPPRDRDRDRDSQPPRRNFDSDRPPRNRDDRPPRRDDDRDFRRSNNSNSNNSDNRYRSNQGAANALSSRRDDRSHYEDRNKSVGGSDGQTANPSPASAAPVKEKPKKKEINDINKMPKVEESKMPNFAETNKFSLLPDEEENEDI